MKFAKYVAHALGQLNAKGEEGMTKTQFLTELSQRCGVSLLTLQNLERGSRLVNYTKAKAVSDATGGQVTIKELCE